MRVVAFAGPSLPAAERAAFPGVEWRPPAEAGDLLRLAADPPETICLIDGWFDHRPAVRHKEILWLLSRGVRIFGAGSIGALRAAEMHSFGMIGIGTIFRAYADDRIQGDDEVALVHAPAEWDWRPLSVPLVEVRATLHRGLRERSIEAAETRELMRSARALHYVDRSWALILEGTDLGANRLKVLDKWIERFAVPQKTLDARLCVQAALEPVRPVPARPEAVRTAFLDALARECGVSLAP